jgi:DNA polymerase-4
MGQDPKNLLVRVTPTKSIGLGRTFDPIRSRDELRRRVVILARDLSFLAYKGGHNPLRYALEIKYQYNTKAKGYININRNFSEILLKQELVKIFESIDQHPTQAVVQINITLSNFSKNKRMTLNMFEILKDQNQVKINETLQKLRERFGVDIIKSGGEL